MATNLDDRFRETVSRQPDHPAILGPGPDERLTYAQLDAAIEATAAEMRSAGLGPGMCCGLHYPSGVDYIIHNYAIWRCGATVVPIAVELAAEEKADVVRRIHLSFVVSSPTPIPIVAEQRAGDPARISAKADIIKLKPSGTHPAGFRDVDASFIRFTSGTTGTSKGVILSHNTVFERIVAANEVLHIGPEDRVMWMLSMSYHFTVSIVGYLTFGAAIVLAKNNFAVAIANAIRDHKATLLYASPMHCALLADYEAGEPMTSLRLAISTTTSLDERVAERFRERYGLPISQALGLIEVGLPCINVQHAGRKHGSVGPVLPAYEIKLEDTGLGDGLREVCFRGPGCLDAYYHPWRTRDDIMPDGWFRTHDVGEVDDDGCLFLRGRSKDLINVAGMKFFPHEVESVLQDHPRVAEACVFSHPHDRTGEVARAHVVPTPGPLTDGLEQQLRSHCQLHIAAYKVPERIEFVDRLARTASGKILHRIPARRESPSR
ncbi:MAG: acyl--CoA ligase [Myxococcales bacterium FL481]|nr:MAG: acyl--CoA ligase [Myxococcales bacterium FL481]